MAGIGQGVGHLLLEEFAVLPGRGCCCRIDLRVTGTCRAVGLILVCSLW
jgi:hypothetical protein